MSPYTVAVRALCEFTAKEGDLDLRFTPSPSAQDGIDGHALVASRRQAGWQAEVTLAGSYRSLRVRGRADGWHIGRRRLEEVKTYRGRLDRQPANHRALHWAQAMVYGWLLCEQHGLPEIELALVYFDIGSQRETAFEQTCSAADLQAHFERRCAAFLQWAEQELAHRAARDAALETLAFPHADFRRGQRPLAESVYRAAMAGRVLMAQAPTGIGKTVGTLYPLLRASPAQRLDKLFFLTAKTSGRAPALAALAVLRADAAGSPLRPGAPGLPLRALELVARAKACEHPQLACHGQSCPLARGFYDRLPAARSAALELPVWDAAGVRALAARHAVCPHYLRQELVRWSDVVVGDVNHYFDQSALLHALAVAQGWRVGLLVDEAHNLLERSRAMYTAELHPAGLARARRAAPAALQPALGRVQRCWKALDGPPAARAAADAAGTGKAMAEYEVRETAPASLVAALQQACSAVLDAMADDPVAVGADLLQFCFDALHFCRLADSFGEHSLFDLMRPGGSGPARLCLRNVVPATFLAPRWRFAQTATLFSATLTPRRFHAELLGLPGDAGWIDVEPPFERRQLAVHLADDICTRYERRAASVGPIVGLIWRQFDARPGNYLAFFSSFDYLDRVAAAFSTCHPGVPVWQQARGMSEADQAVFLARFACGGRGIGFAVLGGAFAEGIDLAGERLVGAFITTLGLPQVNPVNEQMRRRIDRLCGTGFAYTYLYPGLQKVVQAAGRVIRTPLDEGVVHLIDDRFNRADVKALLPRWWGV